MKKLLAVLVSGFFLSGCAVLDTAYLVYLIADQRTVVKSDQEIELTEGQRVHAASFTGQPLIWQEHCDAKGVVVDYVRDWNVLDEETGQIIFESDPLKIYGQAIILYSLACREKPVKSILLTDERRPIIGKSLKIRLNEEVRGSDYFSKPDSAKPRWMTQVIKTIQMEAATNPAAQEFLIHVKIENGMPLPPETPKSGVGVGDVRLEVKTHRPA